VMKRKMRVAQINVLIDVETDAEACDFLSEMLRGEVLVYDWSYSDACLAAQDAGEGVTTRYSVDGATYDEGEFVTPTGQCVNGQPATSATIYAQMRSIRQQIENSNLEDELSETYHVVCDPVYQEDMK